MRIGIDLLWVRPGICGGTESFARNLLDGFARYGADREFVLFTAKDNGESFEKYGKSPNMKLVSCQVNCSKPVLRIAWENLHLDRMAQNYGIDVMFIPVYSKPQSFGSPIPYACVIHDLQAFHYPQYFSWPKRMFFRLMWRYACESAKRIIVSSEDCRRDLTEHYPGVSEKLEVIPIPVLSKPSGLPASHVRETYRVEPGKYYYCVSSLLPHKNLGTVLRAIALLKKDRPGIRLVLSGVGGRDQEFDAMLKELELKDIIIQTGFISDAERDCLYENCSVFLFPSVFEGFGMPPVEALRKGKNVVMTKKSCLYEVTDGKAIYVEDPYDAEEWAEKILAAESGRACREAFPQYTLETVTQRYLAMLERCGSR